MRFLAPLLLIALAACAAFPALDGVETPAAARADYPQLVPLTGLLAGVTTGTRIDPTLSSDLAARATRLRARAAAMRRSAVSPAEVARLRDAIARLSR